MNKETKQCQNCKKEFVIESEDFDFYERIKVPPPTFCPKCRLQRRLAFFNVFNLYKRPCDLCKKEVISVYRPASPYTVYCPKCWWSDDWDALKYGRDYDFSKPFFAQLDELWHQVPLLGLSLNQDTIETSPYTNHTQSLKNCYLIFNSGRDENCAYGFYLVNADSVFESALVRSSEICYDSMNCFKVSRCIGSVGLTQSIDCSFLKDSTNCQNCFGSSNLRNKKYHIFNKPHSKEDYFREIKQWDLGSYESYGKIKKLVASHGEKLPPKPRWDELSVDVTGNYVFESKNCKECFEVIGAQNCKYLFGIDPTIRDSYDVSSWGENQELSYECNVVGHDVSQTKFCEESGHVLSEAEYSKLSTGASHHFGCVSVKKQDYCILNKKYPKNEYVKLVERIKKHMDERPYADKKGRTYKYGEFLPIELSPFAYNETIANNFFPLSKEEIGDNGYKFNESEAKNYAISKKASELPDHVKDAKDELLKETIECENCGKGFKIIEMELAFLRKINLPLPRKCPFCRISEKFNQWVKKLRIIERNCDKCGTSFETNYSKEEAPYILCKECYLKQVV